MQKWHRTLLICLSGRSMRSSADSAKQQHWQNRLALIWYRCMATGCAAASVQPSSIIGPTNTAAVQKTALVLRWKRSRLSMRRFRGCPLITSWPSGRKTALRECWRCGRRIFVPLLERAGVTSFHVTLANHSALENTIPPANHPYFGHPGCFLKFCNEVRQYTDLPICGVGG